MMQRRKPSGLSPSSIELWLQCPRRFEKEKIEGRDGGTNMDAFVGTFVHRILELLMQHPAGGRTVEAARESARTAWAELASDRSAHALGVLEGAAATEFRRRSWQSVRGYFTIENPDRVTVISTEQFIETVVGEVPVRGIIDRLDRDVFDDLVVTDYKSGKVTARPFRGPKLRQLNLYAAMVEQVTGERPSEGRLLFTTFGETIDTIITEESVGEAVEVAQSVWTALDEAMKADSFEPRPGPLCGWCTFVGECPEGLVEIRERRSAGKLKRSAPAFELAAQE